MRHLICKILIFSILFLPLIGCDKGKKGESGKTEVKEIEEGKKEGKPQPAEEFITNSIGMKFKFILGGSFLMGSPDCEKDRNNDEGSQHQVTLTKPYYLGVYEVTQEQYEKVMGLNPSQYKDAKSPVENVSWDDAQEFCRKLSELEKNTIYRLPTEAEWEYACRAGTTTAYYWGDSFDAQYAWTKENHDGTTKEIGTRQANPWGLFDMSGNVWEWCADWYSADYSEVSEQVDPKGADTGLYRVIRGGSWYSDPQYCRSAFRLNPAPDFRISYLGFRVLAVPAVGRGSFNPEFVEKQVQKETVPQQRSSADESVRKSDTPSPNPPDSGVISNAIGMKLKLIPAGSFLMGSPTNDDEDRESPQHMVTLTKPFYLGIYEVTQEQYVKVMGMNPSDEKGSQKPVEMVSWNEAKDFCKKLSKIDKQEYRLPTEAEWEYACRAGTQTAFYWGDTYDERFAWCGKGPYGKTQDVGMLQPNAWGLYDMSGNVREWCEDWEGDYTSDEQVDPKGVVTDSNRVYRVGSFYDVPQFSRSAFRVDTSPNDYCGLLGFRVVAVPAVGQ